MLFNPDTNKPAQEILFSRKEKIQNHPNISLNKKLNFKEHIDSTILKMNRGIRDCNWTRTHNHLVRKRTLNHLAKLNRCNKKKLRYSLPRKSLITIYKALLRTLRDYGDITYDQPHNESVQYKVAVAITSAIQGTSREKFYQELGLESLRGRRWYKRLSCMFKIVKEEAPNYLINLIPKIQQTARTRINRIPTFHCRTDCFKNSFFPSTLNDLYKLNETIRSSESISIFKSRLLSFIRLLESNVYI